MKLHQESMSEKMSEPNLIPMRNSTMDGFVHIRVPCTPLPPLGETLANASFIKIESLAKCYSSVAKSLY